MEKEKKIIDVNAHVTNIQPQVYVNEGNARAKISFDNLGYGKVTAIKFNAIGYNSFGDVVKVSDKEDFLIIIQDISIEKNSSAKDIEVSLPSNEIRRLELEEKQVCFYENTVLTYEGKKEIALDVDKFSYNGQDRIELDALREVFDPNVTYNLLETNDGWFCSCGRFNNIKANKCSLCGHSLEEVRANLSPDGRKKAIEKKEELDKQ